MTLGKFDLSLQLLKVHLNNKLPPLLVIIQCHYICDVHKVCLTKLFAFLCLGVFWRKQNFHLSWWRDNIMIAPDSLIFQEWFARSKYQGQEQVITHTDSVGCNYLSLALIPVSGTTLLSLWPISTNGCLFLWILSILSWRSPKVNV